MVRDARLRPARPQQFPALPQTSCMTWQLLNLQVPPVLLKKVEEEGDNTFLPYWTVQVVRQWEERFVFQRVKAASAAKCLSQ